MYNVAGYMSSPRAHMNGTGIVVKNISMIQTIWANAKGNGTVVNLVASMKFTCPQDKSWNTRDKIGAAMSMTLLRDFSTISRWTHCMATLLLAEVPAR